MGWAVPQYWGRIVEAWQQPLRSVAVAARRWIRAAGRPLRAVVVGCGEISPTHIEAYERAGLAHVRAVCDVRTGPLADALQRWPRVRGYRDCRQMLREVRPDLVSVCTWPHNHAEIVLAAVEAGARGILCEKPLALRMGDVDRMLAVCGEHGVKLAVGQHWRFHPNFVQAAQIIRAGTLGQIVAARGHIVGSLADNGPHLLDAARFLLGEPEARSVTCRCQRTGGRFYHGVPSEDAAEGLVTFAEGFSFQFRTGELAPGYFAITVEGTRASLEVTRERLVLDEGISTEDRSVPPEDLRRAQFRQFARWVAGRQRDYPADGACAARATELVLASYESARLATPVELPLLNRGDVIEQLYGPAVAAAHPPLRPQREATTGRQSRLALDGGRPVVRSRLRDAPTVGRRETAALARAVRRRSLDRDAGPETTALEEQFARLYGTRHAVACSSGTAAIHLALGALNPDPGDEVVTTPLTDMGTIIPILACNAVPVFADVDAATGNLTAATIARRLTPRTRAVIVVHLFGRPAEMDEITELLRQHRIPLIEDCAQAHGAQYRGRKVGTFGDFGCFSLHSSAQITCGEGGVTLVNRPELAERAALFADKGRDRRFGHAHLLLGMNYRMTELQAAVARVQLTRLEGLLRRRRRAADRLSQALERVEGIILPPAQDQTLCSWWAYHFAIDEGRLALSTGEFHDALRAEGVRLQRHVPGAVFEYEVLKHQRTYGQSRFPFSAVDYAPPDLNDFPGLREFNRRALLIPWSHRASDWHVERIATAVRKLAAHCWPTRAPTEQESTQTYAGATHG